MNTPFEIRTDWLNAEAGQSQGSTELSIWIGGQCATEVEEQTTREIRRTIRTSAPDLARWLAGNWWRLRWEPRLYDDTGGDAALDWRMSHDVGCIGNGQVWPSLVFTSEGDSIKVFAQATEPVPAEPIFYRQNFTKRIPADVFESEVDRFIEETIEKTTSRVSMDTDLPDLWNEVLGERNDPEATELRKLEAHLGYDAGEAPEELLDNLLRESEKYGTEAVQEVAAYSKGQALDHIRLLSSGPRSTGDTVSVPDFHKVRKAVQSQVNRHHHAWEQAERAAQEARRIWNITQGPISNETLRDLLHADPLRAGQTSPPLSAGIKDDDRSERFHVFLKPRGQNGRRFTMSRLLGDCLVSPEGETLMPATHTKSYRQRFQRAFAREFLCPFENLKEMVGTEAPSTDDIESAAEHFQVSEFTVTATLVSKGMLERDTLNDWTD